MKSEFNVNDYWRQRGQGYMQERRTPPEFHRLQEQFLIDALQRSAVPMGRVLEIGCGFGRITKRLAETWPEAEITALDLSPDQLANARRYCAGCANVRFEPYDFYSDAPFPGGACDTVMSIEVFLHHPPEVVVGLFRKLAASASHLVNIDWSEEWPWPTPEHVWVHDFAKLYAEAGLQCALFPLPEKIEDKQQKLFIGARELSAPLREAERDWREKFTPAAATSRPAPDWTEQLGRATAEILDLIPAGTSFILVDDGQWGVVRAFAGHQVIPFLERAGQFWGPPADDETAIRELDRLRLAGAQYIVFAWSTFWWLEHYREFHRHLRTRFPCVAEHERLIVFRLES